jgi:hypothetical protein
MLCIIVQYVVLRDPNDNNNLSYAIYFEPCPREPDNSAGFLLQFRGDLSRDVPLAFNTSRTSINPLSMAQTVCIQHIGWADPYSDSAITNECANIPLATSSGDDPGQLPGQPPHNAAELINTAIDKLIAAGVLMLHRENIRPNPVFNHGMNRDTFPGLVLWQKRVPVPVVTPDQGDAVPVPVVVPGQGDTAPAPVMVTGQDEPLPVPVVAPGQGGVVQVTVVVPDQSDAVPVPVVVTGQDEALPVPVVVSGRGDAVPVPVVAPGRGGMVHVTVVSSEGGGVPVPVVAPGQGGVVQVTVAVPWNLG